MQSWLKRVSGSRESGQAAIAKETPLHAIRYVVLDTELTSLDPRTNRLLSIGAIGMQGPSIRLGEQFYRVVNPQVSIPASTVVVHKLRSEDVAEGDALDRTMVDLYHFIAGAVLVGHFVEIELKILNKEMASTGHTLENPAIDTAKVHQWLLRHGTYSEELPLELEKLDLATLAKFYGVKGDDPHHALADAFLTACMWQKMLAVLPGKGIRTLRKLLRIAGA